MGIVVSALFRLFWGMGSILEFWNSAEGELTQYSRVGESPMERRLREKRRFWTRFFFATAFMILAAGLGLAFVKWK